MRIKLYISSALFIAFLLAAFSCVAAQNLVRNPSFESHTNCPPNLGYIMYVNDWTKPTNHVGSSDYFHTCAYGTVVYVLNNFLGGQWPATGDAYMGIILKEKHFHPWPTYREYLQNHLQSPLVAGQTYTVSLKCSLSDTSSGFPSVTTNALNMYLSATPVSAPAINNYTEPLNVTPQFNSLVTLDTSSWTTVAFNYTALGGEEYLLIGNFKTDSSTYSSANISRIYGFIDDVSVRIADIAVSGNLLICPGESTTLTASQSLTYAWANANNPNVILSTSPSFTVSPTVNTTYYVYGNADTTTVTVQMKPVPYVHLGNDTVACATENLLLIAYSGGSFVQGTQFLWSTGNTTPFLTPTQSGTYWAQATLNGCVNRDTINVIINPNPVVNLGPDRGICPADSIVLNVSNANATYVWQDGSSNPTFTVKGSGTFYVTVSIGNCTKSDTVLITNAPAPVLNLGPNISVCSGTNVTLNANASNDSFLWSNGATSATISPTQSGNYSVIATLGNCQARDTVHVQFLPLPSINLGNDTMPCIGSQIMLNAAYPNATYQWQDNSQSATYAVQQSGLYHVSVTDANQCVDRDTIRITFVHMPHIEFYDSTLCYGQHWELDITTLGATYLWQDKSTGPSFTIDGEGTYWAKATNACGTDSDTLQIKYEHCDCYLFIPNTVTANGDNINETFHVTAKYGCDLSAYTFSLFDRWGQLIYESQNIETDWVAGTTACDVYMYRIVYKFSNAPQKMEWGKVLVLK